MLVDFYVSPSSEPIDAPLFAPRFARFSISIDRRFQVMLNCEERPAASDPTPNPRVPPRRRLATVHSLQPMQKRLLLRVRASVPRRLEKVHHPHPVQMRQMRMQRAIWGPWQGFGCQPKRCRRRSPCVIALSSMLSPSIKGSKDTQTQRNHTQTHKTSQQHAATTRTKTRTQQTKQT